MNCEEENKLLKIEIEGLQKELNDTKEKLKKYTAPERNKKYYNLHKEEIITNQKPASSEKRKEYNRNSYLKRKELILNANKYLNT
jgi:hypothetical protein